MKRLLLVVALLLPMGEVRAQAIAPPWTCSLDNLFDIPKLCIVAPEPGQRRYITDVIVQSTDVTPGLWALYYGTGTDCATGLTQLLPAVGGTTGKFASPDNRTPPVVVQQTLIVPPGKDFCVQGDTGTGITVQVVGTVGF